MTPAGKTLLKVLVAIVSYGVTLALAFSAVNQIFNVNESFFAIVAVIIIAIFGFIATKDLPFFYAISEGTGSIPVTMFLLSLRVAIAFFTGVFVAPWKIAKALVSLIPGGAEEE